MRRTTANWRHCALALVATGVLAVVGATAAASQQPAMLVEYLPEAAVKAAGGDGAPEHAPEGLGGNASVLARRVGHAAPEPVIQAGALSIELPGSGEIAIFDDLIVDALDPGGYAIYSRDRRSGSTVTLVVMGDDVIGTLHHDGATYEVQPLGGGLTAVYLYDGTQSRSPPFVNDIVVQDIAPKAAAVPELTPLSEQGDDDAIDVLVAYSSNVKRATANIDARIALLLLQTHLVYANSGIDKRVRVVHSYQTSYVPLAERNPGVRDRDLDRMRASDDGFADEAHGLRERYGADIVALLFQHSGSFCGGGIAYSLPSDPVGDLWTDYAFMVSGLGDVASGCIEDDGLTFAHEVGHLQGAEHNPEDPTTTANRHYAYGHGNCNAATGWRTVMALDTNGRCPKQIPYFSGPEVLYEGTATGDAGVRNVARLVNETSDTVADHLASAALPISRTHRLPLFVSAAHGTPARIRPYHQPLELRRRGLHPRGRRYRAAPRPGFACARSGGDEALQFQRPARRSAFEGPHRTHHGRPGEQPAPGARHPSSTSSRSPTRVLAARASSPAPTTRLPAR